MHARPPAASVTRTGEAPRTVAVLVRTLVGRGDPALVFDAEVEVTLPEGK